MTMFNHCVNHVAISVPNLEAAIEFYSKLFGFRFLRPSGLANKEEHPQGITWKSTFLPLPLCLSLPLDAPSQKLTRTAVYGKELNSVKMAIMTTGNSVGFEIFEFVDPPYDGKTAPLQWGPGNYAKGGWFHVAFTVPDPVATLREAEKMGAKLVGEICSPAPGETVIYMQDPWDNVVELLSCSFEHLIMNGVAA
ncbi:hypothetical protein AYO21_10621 [Fonsecaea monophora]|uniref:VOC domain-containing protein n=1 Tax=Fonsecaea monophora TaxID=254056 RepID=A0A177ET79_9EURO|nr:hypothetical protein AYO21_10621 [Fonsecaea monophora]KAH0829715.1 putative glyoxalase family protein [Fonsecaea pedrosoi]OAG35223.1 hypothetical protein AYO21_10621 [Fonsecaea monophora]